MIVRHYELYGICIMHQFQYFCNVLISVPRNIRGINCLPCVGGMRLASVRQSFVKFETYEEALEVSFNVSDKIIRRNDGDVCSVKSGGVASF